MAESARLDPFARRYSGHDYSNDEPYYITSMRGWLAIKAAIAQATGRARKEVGAQLDAVLTYQARFLHVNVTDPKAPALYVSGPPALYAMYERIVQIYEEEAAQSE